MVGMLVWRGRWAYSYITNIPILISGMLIPGVVIEGCPLFEDVGLGYSAAVRRLRH